MVAANTLDGVQLELDFLAGTELGQEDVAGGGLDGVVAKDLGLGALGDPLQRGGVEAGVLEFFFGVQ